MDKSPLKVSVGNPHQAQQSPEQYVNSFITAVGENRQAFDIFKEHAQQRGIMQGKKPLMHSQQEYYERFISTTNKQ